MSLASLLKTFLWVHILNFYRLDRLYLYTFNSCSRKRSSLINERVDLTQKSFMNQFIVEVFVSKVGTYLIRDALIIRFRLSVLSLKSLGNWGPVL